MKLGTLKKLFLIGVVLSLTGCWDYVGLNNITIVTGISIDKDKKTDKYDLSFEFVDLGESAKDKTIGTKIIDTTGDTIFDAVRNAKKKVMNKLYFSNAEVIVVSEDIAKKDGINSIINWFIRDAEVRETTNIIISKEKKAKDILGEKVVDSSGVSFEIKKIVESDNSVTASTTDMPLYKIYNLIECKTRSLALPLFSNVENDNHKTAAADGIALFKADKMIGTLNSEESKYYLFIENSIEGGLLTLNYKNKENTAGNVTLEIANNTTMESYTYKDNKLKILLKPKVEVYLAEYDEQSKKLDDKTIDAIQKKAESDLKKNMLKLISKAKKEYKHDIFSFGDMVYKRDAKLWDKLKSKWDKVFIASDVEINPTVEIVNSALLK